MKCDGQHFVFGEDKNCICGEYTREQLNHDQVKLKFKLWRDGYDYAILEVFEYMYEINKTHAEMVKDRFKKD